MFSLLFLFYFSRNRYRLLINSEKSYYSSNKEKLRKHYKKLIKHYEKKGLGIKDSSTPMELKNGILNLTSNNIENITKIYDKARYSLYEPTKEDIDKLMKK